MDRRRLSSAKVLFLSPSSSCRMDVVLMQGNMHWRWAQRPPTQSVCLSAASGSRSPHKHFLSFLFPTGHWEVLSISFWITQIFTITLFKTYLSRQIFSSRVSLFVAIFAVCPLDPISLLTLDGQSYPRIDAGLAASLPCKILWSHIKRLKVEFCSRLALQDSFCKLNLKNQREKLIK